MSFKKIVVCISFLNMSLFASGTNARPLIQNSEEKLPNDKTNTLMEEYRTYRPCKGPYLQLDQPFLYFPRNDTERHQQLNQIKITLYLAHLNFKLQNFTELYEDINKGILKTSYKGTWYPHLPKNLEKLTGHTTQIKTENKELIEWKIVKHFPNFLKGLLKFQVRFQRILNDIHNDGFYHRGHFENVSPYLTNIFCQVETFIADHFIPINQTNKQEHFKTSYDQNKKADETETLIEDWEIIFRYDDFFNSWLNILKHIPESNDYAESYKNTDSNEKTDSNEDSSEIKDIYEDSNEIGNMQRR